MRITIFTIKFFSETEIKIFGKAMINYLFHCLFSLDEDGVETGFCNQEHLPLGL